MSEQETFNKTGVNDSTDVAQIIEEKPVDSSEKISNDLKLPVSTEVESKNANSFQSTVKTDSDDKNIDTRADESSLTEHKNLGNVGVSEQNSGTIITANIIVQPKKKISFQVTSIESTEGRSRGDSNGYDDIDELNETEDVEEEEIYNESGVAHVLGNGNGTSRFKVVKIPRYDSKPYTRGRWRCWDFVKYPPPSAEHLLPDLPGCNSDVSNEKGDAEPVIRNTLTSSSNTGALSLSSNQNIDFPATEGNSQANLSSETNCDDKSHIIPVLDAVENSFVAKADNGPDELLNSISAVENAGASISEAAVANTDEGLSRYTFIFLSMLIKLCFLVEHAKHCKREEIITKTIVIIFSNRILSMIIWFD